MSQDNGNSTLEMGTSDQVLVATKRKKTLTYVIGGVVMVAIIAVVVTLVVVFTGNDGTAEPIVSTTEGPTTPISTTTLSPTTTTPTPVAPTTTEAPVTEPPPEPLDLESVISGVFAPNSFNATWSQGSDVLFRNANGDLVMYDVDTDTTVQLISNTSLTLQQSARVTELSADQTHVVLAYNLLPIFRYSFMARYAVVDLVSGNETDILPPTLRSSEALLQNFVWGPSGTTFAFVYMNNIYYQPSLTSKPEQITTTGQFNVVYHGIPDWVYEEEVFGSSNAMYFSADGSKLAYVTFDDTNVRVMKVPHYGVPGSLDYQYTQHHEIRYPKTGTTNPTVSVTIRELVSGNNTVFNGPTDLQEPILKSVRFVDNDTIAVLWTNRVQNTLRILLCTEGQAACNVIYSYNETDGWIDNIPVIFNQLGNAFVTILPQAVGGVSYRQIVQISQSTGTNLWTSSPRINTPNTVSEIMDWTQDDVIWYRATNVNDSAEQHIYTVNATGYISCFTCNIRRSDGGECLYNDGILSASRNRITVNCAGPDVPQIFIYDTNGNYIRTWDDNAELSAMLENRTQSTTIRLTVPMEGNQVAAAQLEVPADYLTRTNVPLLVYVYGGPDISLVTKQWSLDWGSSLVSRWGIAVAQIDGRGSGLRDVSNLFAVNRRLGTVEVDDQINVTRYLQDNLSWVDRNRTCIWGWSYGGYAASLALARGENVFRCAAAIAPVVDWRFYDSIYTERYMDLPSANPQAYEVSSLLTEDLVEAYRNKSYFLIHGTADDNVHYQQSMLISRLLQRRNVYFTQMSYTDEDHGLSGVRPHLYHALETFLEEHML